ncbi:MAG TPA: acyl-CoA dehydrogenase family protein, partial [Myxococcota bacterium]
LARETALARGDLTEAERERIEKELERDNTRVRLLTPLCKYFATEVCSDLTRDALQVFGGIGFTMDADVGKLHADSLIMTIYEGTSEIQASFALREMGKGALAVVFKEVRAELASMEQDPARAEMARRVREVTVRVEDTLRVLFSDLSYALLRSKLMAAMVIDVISATELLKQVSADRSRIDIAEAFIRRRSHAVEDGVRRIEDYAVDRLARDARLVERIAPA